MDDGIGVTIFGWCLGVITVLMLITLLVLVMAVTYQVIVEGVVCG